MVSLLFLFIFLKKLLTYFLKAIRIKDNLFELLIAVAICNEFIFKLLRVEEAVSISI
jgi:hypothetical protein